MTRTLIIYSSVDGQTLAICQRLATLNTEEGAEVTLARLEDAESLKLTEFDKILIGASIRYGKHRPALYAYVNRHRAELDTKVNAFFSVNVVARKPEKNTPQTNPYMLKFLRLSQWQPKHMEVFAGKIDYPIYGFFDRTMIRFIMWLTKGPTDTSGTFEFTDWDKVEAFGRQFAKLTD
jgi:menaquinone-dependent protoporphyrinogen oxidase